jgi:hypothetical protein
MNILIFILTTFGLGILCSVPGVVIGRLLAAKEIAREKPLWAGLFNSK